MGSKSVSQISKETGLSYSDARKLNPAYKLLDDVNSHEPSVREEKDLSKYTSEFRQRLAEGVSLDKILPEAYAVVREAARRIYGNNGEQVEGSARDDPEKCEEIFGEGETPKFGRHFDVQVIGGIMLHKGYVSEMHTGEGKTLAATLPAYLNALEGEGVHIVTSNDYLAQRDAKWMAPLFNLLGLNVGTIHEKDNVKSEAHVYNPDSSGKSASRKDAYLCDVTYGTSSEFGFDYLRDNIAQSLEAKVQRGYNYAIIDEVDNLLIDEAGTPLIRSAKGKPDAKNTEFADLIARRIIQEQKVLIETKRHNYEQKLEEMESKGQLTKSEKRLKEELERKLASIEYPIAGKDVGGSVRYDYHEQSESPNFYQIDPKKNRVYLDDQGMKWMEENVNVLGRSFGIYDCEDVELIERVNNALKAHTLLYKDADYVVETQESPLQNSPNLRGYLEVLVQLAASGHEGSQEKLELYEKMINDVCLDFALDTETDFGEFNWEEITSRLRESVPPEKSIVIVDQGTGRKMPDRRWSDGLHAAVEAKEKVEIRGDNRPYGVITLPFYFAKYAKRAGMTGTAKTDADEFRQVYGMDVVQIPTNKPVKRVDYTDLVYATEDEKFEAVAAEIKAWHAIGRPVLIGTTSIEKSEKLAEKLKEMGITDYEVLNARRENLAREAEIITKAGQKGSITIATNMAGRGTDISLGEGIAELGKGYLYSSQTKTLIEASSGEDSEEGEGGLVVIGTERHSSRRIDNQLRGRAGRQGDPGTTRFYTSLDDQLYWFVSDKRKEKMKTHFAKGEAIESELISRAIAGAQSIMVENQSAQRKNLVKYDSVLNKQRDVVYGLRDIILEEGRIRTLMFDTVALDDIIKNTANDSWNAAVDQVAEVKTGTANYSREFIEWFKENRAKEMENGEKLEFKPADVSESDMKDFLIGKNLSMKFGLNIRVPDNYVGMFTTQNISDEAVMVISRQIMGGYNWKRHQFGAEHFDEVERNTLLGVLDTYWKDHLARLKWLRERIWLRSYAQKDPRVEYMIDSSDMFDQFIRNAFCDTMKAMVSLDIPKKDGKTAIAV